MGDALTGFVKLHKYSLAPKLYQLQLNFQFYTFHYCVNLCPLVLHSTTQPVEDCFWSNLAHFFFGRQIRGVNYEINKYYPKKRQQFRSGQQDFATHEVPKFCGELRYFCYRSRFYSNFGLAFKGYWKSDEKTPNTQLRNWHHLYISRISE